MFSQKCPKLRPSAFPSGWIGLSQEYLDGSKEILFVLSSYEFLAMLELAKLERSLSFIVQSDEITVWKSISRSHTASSHKDTWRLIWWGNYFSCLCFALHFILMFRHYLVKGLFVRNWKLKFMQISWWTTYKKSLLFPMKTWAQHFYVWNKLLCLELGSWLMMCPYLYAFDFCDRNILL